MVDYLAVRFNVDSPVVPNPTGSPMSRVPDHGSASASPGYRRFSHPAFLTKFARQFRIDDPASRMPWCCSGREATVPRRPPSCIGAGLGEPVLLGSDPDLELNRDVLMEKGVPARAILSLGPTIGTRKEAWRVRDYATAHPGIRRITVVTTAFHTVHRGAGSFKGP